MNKAQGRVNLGFFGKAENRTVAEKMREVFSAWIDNGHNNLQEENTVILKTGLASGVLFSHSTRYDITF